MKFLRESWFPLLLGLIILVVILSQMLSNTASVTAENIVSPTQVNSDDWRAPDIDSLANDEHGNLVRYGHQLIVNTSIYFGPKGTVAAITNGMNCQNCHLDAGARSFAGAFSAVASTYPRYRERSGRIESIEFRINDCLMRSLDGKPIDSLSKEMRAMVSYLQWIGKDVPKNKKPQGAGLQELKFLDRAADPEKGKLIFTAKCTSCHGDHGQGLVNHDSSFYLYPPLWGPGSFNVSAGLYRITRMASFVKNNMPFGQATHNAPQLSDGEAWDVSAFILSQPRPEKFFSEDWPNRETKPVDFPFGPYTDKFSETQHKYGPFVEIQDAKEKEKSKK